MNAQKRTIFQEGAKKKWKIWTHQLLEKQLNWQQKTPNTQVQDQMELRGVLHTCEEEVIPTALHYSKKNWKGRNICKFRPWGQHYPETQTRDRDKQENSRLGSPTDTGAETLNNTSANSMHDTGQGSFVPVK